MGHHIPVKGNAWGTVGSCAQCTANTRRLGDGHWPIKGPRRGTDNSVHCSWLCLLHGPETSLLEPSTVRWLHLHFLGPYPLGSPLTPDSWLRGQPEHVDISRGLELLVQGRGDRREPPPPKKDRKSRTLATSGCVASDHAVVFSHVDAGVDIKLPKSSPRSDKLHVGRRL